MFFENIGQGSDRVRIRWGGKKKSNLNLIFQVHVTWPEQQTQTWNLWEWPFLQDVLSSFSLTPHIIPHHLNIYTNLSSGQLQPEALGIFKWEISWYFLVKTHCILCIMIQIQRNLSWPSTLPALGTSRFCVGICCHLMIWKPRLLEEKNSELHLKINKNAAAEGICKFCHLERGRAVPGELEQLQEKLRVELGVRWDWLQTQVHTTSNQKVSPQHHGYSVPRFSLEHLRLPCTSTLPEQHRDLPQGAAASLHGTRGFPQLLFWKGTFSWEKSDFWVRFCSLYPW